jgi:hypothetical protein
MATRDKRRSPRHQVENVQGTLHFNTEARILNMSLAGLALESPLPVRVGRTYAITLRRDDNETVQMPATVVWCHLREIRKNSLGESQPIYAAGLSFTDTLTDKAGQLIRFLERSAAVTVGQRVTGRFRLSHEQSAVLQSAYEFEIKTISLHGLLLDTELAPQLGAIFDIEIYLPGCTIETRARVAYAKDARLPDRRTISELGMEFVDFSEEDRDRLADYIASELRPSDPAPT